MESADTISPFKSFASFKESAVFPTAVGPVSMIKLFFFSVFVMFVIGSATVSASVRRAYETIRWNFFSSSVLLMEMIVGLPCGHVYGFSRLSSLSTRASIS